MNTREVACTASMDALPALWALRDAVTLCTNAELQIRSCISCLWSLMVLGAGDPSLALRAAHGPGPHQLPQCHWADCRDNRGTSHIHSTQHPTPGSLNPGFWSANSSQKPITFSCCPARLRRGSPGSEIQLNASRRSARGNLDEATWVSAAVAPHPETGARAPFFLSSPPATGFRDKLMPCFH